MVVGLYAGILGILYVGLSLFVIMGRYKYRVSVGDGGSELLQKRIRLHGNFIEYVPLALVLMLLVEKQGISSTWIHCLGVALVLARLSHIYGFLTKEGPSIGRASGVITTFVVISVASVLCLWSYIFSS